MVTTKIVLGKLLVVGASRSLEITSEQDARTTNFLSRKINVSKYDYKKSPNPQSPMPNPQSPIPNSRIQPIPTNGIK